MTGPDGLLKQFTKSVLETALNEEMTEHLGLEKNRAPGARDSANVRNGTRAKTVLTHATGGVELAVPETGRAPSNRSLSRSGSDGSPRSTRSSCRCMPVG